MEYEVYREDRCDLLRRCGE